ncbi:MAG: helix-turn-helix transcriptional regulator [Lachnospiraceae bacterium]|nr:helix-turn-helix transcriptional regulator [Lachnospiraceae bacterium]
MYEVNKEQFGLFLQELRKEKGYTQKDLANLLYVSDKAVSKWERGLSLPDTALLLPISEVLDISVTELLKGERMAKDTQLDMAEVNKLVAKTIDISNQEYQIKSAQQAKWRNTYILCLMVSLAELLLICSFRYLTPIAFPMTNLYVGMLLLTLFSGWFCLKVRDTLPTYYDENTITCYSDGFFRMNLGTIRISNKNWSHIVKVGRIGLCLLQIFYPLVYLICGILLPVELQAYVSCTMFLILGIFIPLVYTAKKWS